MALQPFFLIAAVVTRLLIAASPATEPPVLSISLGSDGLIELRTSSFAAGERYWLEYCEDLSSDPLSNWYPIVEADFTGPIFVGLARATPRVYRLTLIKPKAELNEKGLELRSWIAGRFGVAEPEVEVLFYRKILWPDEWLGCDNITPARGSAGQARIGPTPGYFVLASIIGTEYRLRFDGEDVFVAVQMDNSALEPRGLKESVWCWHGPVPDMPR